MVLEHARLRITAGREAEFEAAFTEARSILASAPGCRSVALHRSADTPGHYLLLVGWDAVEDHTVRFPTTRQAADLAAAIAGFFDGEPVVDHYQADSVV